MKSVPSFQVWSSTVALLVAAICLSTLTALTVTTTSQDESDGTCSESEGLKYPRQDGSLLLHNVVSTASTQDEARKLVETSEEIPEGVTTIVVSADEQTNGRGTSGRTWIGAKGNTFVTICIRQSAWMETKLPMTLLPIRIGVIMAERIDALLQSCIQNQHQQSSTGEPITADQHPAMTTIKWPNDILVDEKKISGVLIETSSNYWYLIGIGVNVAHAPTVPPPGRQSTSIGFYCPESSSTKEEKQVQLARQLGENMASDLSQWLFSHKESPPNQRAAEKNRILRNWKQWVDWDMQLVLRDTDHHETVTPVDIEQDGQLRVKGRNGKERLIVTDYFV